MSEQEQEPEQISSTDDMQAELVNDFEELREKWMDRGVVLLLLGHMYDDFIEEDRTIYATLGSKVTCRGLVKRWEEILKMEYEEAFYDSED